jgi:hypothetical protein
MTDQPITTESITASSDRLTAAQEIEAANKRDEQRNVMLGHAVAFLGKHVPSFGDRPFKPDPDETWKTTGESPETFMSHVREDLREGFMQAMIAATNFATRCFEEKS